MPLSAEERAERDEFLDFQIFGLQEQLAQDPRAKGVRSGLGALFYKKGEPKRARTYLEESAKEEPVDGGGNYWFGRLIFEYAMNPKGAVPFLERSLFAYDSQEGLESRREYCEMVKSHRFCVRNYCFRVGDQVICKDERGFWLAGQVVHLLYREVSWPPQKRSAIYRVALVDGKEMNIWNDVESYIRPMPEDRTRKCTFPGVAEPLDPHSRDYLIAAQVDWMTPGQVVANAAHVEDEINHMETLYKKLPKSKHHYVMDYLVVMRHPCIQHVPSTSARFRRFARESYFRRYGTLLKQVSAREEMATRKDLKRALIIGDAYNDQVGPYKDQLRSLACYYSAAFDCGLNDMLEVQHSLCPALVPMGEPEAMCNMAEMDLLSSQHLNIDVAYQATLQMPFDKETLEQLWFGSDPDGHARVCHATLLLAFATRSGYLTRTALVFGHFLREHPNLVEDHALTPFATCLMQAFEINQKLINAQMRVEPPLDPSLPTLEVYAQNAKAFLKLPVKDRINGVPTDLHLEFRKLPIDPFRVVLFAVKLSERRILTALQLPEDLQLNPYSKASFRHAWLKIAFILHMGDKEHGRYRPSLITVVDNARHRAFQSFLREKLGDGNGTMVRLLSPSGIIKSAKHAPLPAEEVVNRFEMQFAKGMVKGVEEHNIMANLVKMKEVLVQGELFGDGKEGVILPEAEIAKNQGNVHHKRNEHLDAKAQYTEGIELLRNIIEPSKAVQELQVKLLSNRCITLLKYAKDLPASKRIPPIATLPDDVDMALSTPWHSEIPLALRKKLMVRKNDAIESGCFAALQLRRLEPGFKELSMNLDRKIQARPNVDSVYYIPGDVARAIAKEQAKTQERQPPAPKQGKAPAKVDAKATGNTGKKGAAKAKPPTPTGQNGKVQTQRLPLPESDDDMPDLMSSSSGSDSEVEAGAGWKPTEPSKQDKKDAPEDSGSDSDMPGLLSSSDSDSHVSETAQPKQAAKKPAAPAPTPTERKKPVVKAAEKIAAKVAPKAAPKAVESDDDLPALVSSSSEDSEDHTPLMPTTAGPPRAQANAQAKSKPKPKPKPKAVRKASVSSEDVPDLVATSSESEDDYDMLRSLNGRGSSAQGGQRQTTKPKAKAAPAVPSDDDMPALTGSSDSDSGQEHNVKPSFVRKEDRALNMAGERGQSTGASSYDPSEVAARLLREEEEKREREEKVRRKRRERAKRKKARNRQKKWEAEMARRKLEEEQVKEAGPKSADEDGDSSDDAKEGPKSDEVNETPAQELEGISGVARTVEVPTVSYTPTAQANSGWDGTDEEFCVGWKLMTGEDAVALNLVDALDECPSCLGEYGSDLKYEYVIAVSPCDHVACVRCIGTQAVAYLKRSVKQYMCLMGCQRWLPVDLLPGVTRELVRRSPLKELCEKLPMNLQESRAVVSRVLEHKDVTYDITKAYERVNEMLMEQVYTKLKSEPNLSPQEKQRIYEEAHKPELRIRNRIKMVRERRDDTAEKSTAQRMQLATTEKELLEELRKASQKARDEIFVRINAVGGMGTFRDGEPLKIDFHQQHVKDATERFDSLVAPVMPVAKKMRLVTGWGKHSDGGISVLQQGLIAHIDEFYPHLHWEKMPDNKGMIVLTYIAPDDVTQSLGDLALVRDMS